MATSGILQVVGIKESAAPAMLPLKAAGFVNTADTVRCPHCRERYMILVDLSKGQHVNVLDLGKAIRLLVDEATAEHSSGHARDRLTVEYAVAQEGVS